MDHLTDPLTVAAALATAAVVCCEIEVGDWGEGGIAEKLFWPLQSAVTAQLGSEGPTAALHYSWLGLLVLPLARWRNIFSAAT